jgi:hypothetical protein
MSATSRKSIYGQSPEATAPDWAVVPADASLYPRQACERGRTQAEEDRASHEVAEAVVALCCVKPT